MRNLYRVAVLALAIGMGLPSFSYGISPVLKEMENGFVALTESVRPCVVNINVKESGGKVDVETDQMDDLFRFFGFPNPEGGQSIPRYRPMRHGQGSGFIYDKEGRIVTNNHVVRYATKIDVTLWNGKKYEATVIGTDPDTDLAVIKIEADFDLPVARLGDSDSLKVGQFAIAIGSPQGFEGSFSFGHISALGRQDLPLPELRFQDFIQTDAAINLGNSGGPLCNLDGDVIGINVAIVGGANSLGFAIPINTAKRIVPTLIEGKKISRGYLGVGITNASEYAEALGLPDEGGAFVKDVQAGTPAERAELRQYDVIRKVNGEPVKDGQDLVNRISAQPPGATVKLEVWRDGKTIDVEAKLDEYAGSVAEASKGKEILGLRVQNLSPELIERMRLKAGTAGVMITDVESGSAAEDAGLSPGDIITEVAQKPVTNVEEFHAAVQENAQPGKSLLIGYIRDRVQHDITVIRIPKEGDTSK